MKGINEATIAGEIASGYRYSHEVHGEKFYMVDVAVERSSGTLDIIPVMVSERMEWLDCGSVKVAGEVRTYNDHADGEVHTRVFVFAQEMTRSDEFEINRVTLDGYICKEPIYRQTPLGREITDLLIAVNRPYGKSDYIPCICWGRNARFASGLPVGTHVKVDGRFQSREYQKKIIEDEYETRTAYEVSLSGIRVAEDEQEEI